MLCCAVQGGESCWAELLALIRQRVVYCLAQHRALPVGPSLGEEVALLAALLDPLGRIIMPLPAPAEQPAARPQTGRGLVRDGSGLRSAVEGRMLPTPPFAEPPGASAAEQAIAAGWSVGPDATGH